MKKIKFMYSKIILLSGLLFVIAVSCEREISDEVEFATLAKTGEIFTDSPIGLGTDFYFPYEGSKPTALSFEGEGYESEKSIRIDVPNADDPEGNYAGGIFRVDGAGRDLTGFDALTFWAKASQGVSVDIGFGEDFLENKYQCHVSNMSLDTKWTKYIIPIPDPSKLFEERGMFRYATGTQETGGFGYTFWIDDLKFEKLGNIAQPRPKIYGGEDLEIQTFVGTDGILDLPTVTFNLGSGQNVTVLAAHSYFDWISSNPSVVNVAKEAGFLEALNPGEAIITASSAGVQAEGTLIVEVIGEFNFAPTQTRDPNNVISLFSDVYSNVPVDFFNGYWEPYQTTESADFEINGDHILNYTNFNFVGTQFQNPIIDATEKPNLHLNMFIPGDMPSNLDFLISIVNFGADDGTENERQQAFFNTSDFVANTWSTLEIPLSLADRGEIGLIIYENINGSTLSNFYLDNIYFYSE